MTNVSKKDIYPAEDANGHFLSGLLTELDIHNSISEHDDNLVFVNYEGIEFDNEAMNPLLSIYFDSESKFARFSLMNAAPEVVNKKTVGPFIDALNRNHVLASYESSESDGNFYITCEYWLNYKYGFNPALIHHLIFILPAIFGGAVEIESSNF